MKIPKTVKELDNEIKRLNDKKIYNKKKQEYLKLKYELEGGFFVLIYKMFRGNKK